MSWVPVAYSLPYVSVANAPLVGGGKKWSKDFQATVAALAQARVLIEDYQTPVSDVVRAMTKAGKPKALIDLVKATYGKASNKPKKKTTKKATKKKKGRK
jgi:hypothetical protein